MADNRMLMAAFATPRQADEALAQLYRFGYAPGDVSVISNTNKYEVPGTVHDSHANGSEVVGSAASGAATGGVIGGLAGLLAGVGIVPAIAGLFIGGPIAAALGLAGAAATTVSGAVTGAAAGGLIGALTGIGVSQETATSYNRIVSEGGVVLGLSGHIERIAEARALLEQLGATDISEVNAPSDSATATDIRASDADEVTQTRPTSMLRNEPSFGERRTTDSDL